jgi:probable rRNA maturation factor
MEQTLVILQKKVAGLTQAALERFVAQARRAAGMPGEVNVLVTGNTEIRRLNRDFRKKDKPTDVLSFAPPTDNHNGGRVRFAGDIAISADIAGENASRFGHPPSEEIKILTLHGILHLAGFDHERDDGIMARNEMQLRHALNLPSALIERVHTSKSRSSKKKRKPHLAKRATS